MQYWRQHGKQSVFNCDVTRSAPPHVNVQGARRMQSKGFLWKKPSPRFENSRIPCATPNTSQKYTLSVSSIGRKTAKAEYFPQVLPIRSLIRIKSVDMAIYTQIRRRKPPPRHSLQYVESSIWPNIPPSPKLQTTPFLSYTVIYVGKQLWTHTHTHLHLHTHYTHTYAHTRARTHTYTHTHIYWCRYCVSASRARLTSHGRYSMPLPSPAPNFGVSGNSHSEC